MAGKRNRFLMAWLGMLLVMLPGYTVDYAPYAKGRVIDSVTKRTIMGASVTSGNTVVLTDESGAFAIRPTGNKIAVRACGYLRTELGTARQNSGLTVSLAPFTPRALYLSSFGIASRLLRNTALEIVQQTEVNALVIDVKGDKGMVTYTSSVPLASQVGAQKLVLIKDMKGAMQSLKDKGVYTIARIVTFKDDLLATGRPGLAVRTRNGQIWRDREHLAWVDPFKKEVWAYNIDIAEEAARYGFDEIQFDYVRFPDSGAPVFSLPSTEESRVNAISGFLAEAKRRLAPYNVFLGADIFGYVCWNRDDTKIGQKLEDLVRHVEYLSPMLYPSGFQYGIPGYRNPVASPHEIVYLSLRKAQERTGLPTVRFRPWLQAFRDYAFDRRHFDGPQVRQQTSAADKFGSHGWMLWNPRNAYSRDGLKGFTGRTKSQAPLQEARAGQVDPYALLPAQER